MNNLNYELLLALVKKLCEGGYNNEETKYNDTELLRNSVLDPEVTDYIYNIKYNLTPEKIVEKALSYRPIITAPPPKLKEEKK